MYVCTNRYFDMQTVNLRIIDKFEIHIRKNQACDTFLHLFSESNVAGTLFWWHCSAIGSSATFHTRIRTNSTNIITHMYKSYISTHKVSMHVSTYNIHMSEYIYICIHNYAYIYIYYTYV